MFAKLKENKFFMSLSGIICSIELVENTRQDSRFSPLPSLSISPLSREKCEAFTLWEKGGDEGK